MACGAILPLLAGPVEGIHQGYNGIKAHAETLQKEDSNQGGDLVQEKSEADKVAIYSQEDSSELKESKASSTEEIKETSEIVTKESKIDTNKENSYSTANSEEKELDVDTAALYEEIPEKGTFRFTKQTPAQDKVAILGNIVTYIDAGTTVNYYARIALFGKTWIKFDSKNNETLYVQIADYDITKPNINRNPSVVPEFDNVKYRSMVSYLGHVQNVGWQNWVKNGQLSGISGRGLRMEALEIKLVEK